MDERVWGPLRVSACEWVGEGRVNVFARRPRISGLGFVCSIRDLHNQWVIFKAGFTGGSPRIRMKMGTRMTQMLRNADLRRSFFDFFFHLR